MTRRIARWSSLAVAAAAALTVALAIPGDARAETLLRPNQPYVSPEDAAELERWLKLKTPAEMSTLGEWAEPRWFRVMRVVGTSPALRAVGAIGLVATGVDLGWRIVRSSTDGSWDRMWARLTGTEVGTLVTTTSCPAPSGTWSFSPNARVSGYVPANSWLFRPGCLSGSSYASVCENGIGTCSMDARLWPIWQGAQAGQVVQVPSNQCTGITTNILCYARYLTEPQMEQLMAPKQLEFFTSQSYAVSTTYTVPAITDSMRDLGRTQIGAEGIATENEINGILAPVIWVRPWDDGTEGGPILALPAAELNETYADYLARLRALGWVGDARLVELAPEEGDPAYGPGAVPCMSVAAGLPIPPYQPITFFANSSGTSSGSGSSGWDCSAAVPWNEEGCEYDEAFFNQITWSQGVQHVDPAAYARACAEAWNYFIDQGGTAMLGHREPNTGDRVKDPAIISELTANGSDIEDWRKWEWGPFTIDGLDFVVHAFKNIDTQEVKTDTALGYKVKFRTEIPPGWGT